MLVGNDIVDLRDMESQPEKIHPGWDQRVFTAGEQKLLAAAPSRHHMRWICWAAKESAFKAAKKLDPNLSFFPRTFEVTDHESTRARVRHDIGSFVVGLDRTPEYVHAVSVPEGAPLPKSRVGRLRLGAWAQQDALSPAGHDALNGSASVQVRDLARAALGPLWGLSPSEVAIPLQNGAPVASAAGKPLPVDLSLSHHGRFLACAWAVLLDVAAS